MWIDAINNKPTIDKKDKWNKDHKISKRVVVWYEGSEYASFARYNHLINHWSIEGHMGFEQSGVKYFMYINNPY